MYKIININPMENCKGLVIIIEKYKYVKEIRKKNMIIYLKFNFMIYQKILIHLFKSYHNLTFIVTFKN